MKFILILFVLLFNLSIKTDTQKYKLPQNEELKLNAKSHILMDFDSGYYIPTTKKKNFIQHR